jgi:hypothetical protein
MKSSVRRSLATAITGLPATEPPHKDSVRGFVYSVTHGTLTEIT